MKSTLLGYLITYFIGCLLSQSLYYSQEVEKLFFKDCGLDIKTFIYMMNEIKGTQQNEILNKLQ